MLKRMPSRTQRQTSRPTASQQPAKFPAQLEGYNFTDSSILWVIILVFDSTLVRELRATQYSLTGHLLGPRPETGVGWEGRGAWSLSSEGIKARVPEEQGKAPDWGGAGQGPRSQRLPGGSCRTQGNGPGRGSAVQK